MDEKISSMNEASNVTILKFSLSDFKTKLNWHEKDEFEFDGKMYDVVKIEESNGGYKVYCFNDEKEEILISNFKKLNDKIGDQKNCITFQHNTFVMLAVENDNFLFKKFNSSYQQPLICINNYTSLSFDIPTPPPRNHI